MSLEASISTPVHHTVGAAVEDDALHVGERVELLQGNVVGMDLAVHAKRPDLSGQPRVLALPKSKIRIISCFIPIPPCKKFG